MCLLDRRDLAPPPPLGALIALAVTAVTWRRRRWTTS